MNETRQGEFRITSENDIVMARKVVRDAATTLGFGITDVTRIVTAASELTRNIYHYAKSGVMHWRSLNQDASVGLELTFEDSGPGIAPEIRPRLFQHFQSTKSSGFGLGLAICNDILTGLDATITVDPAVSGRGATFRLVFPCQA